MTTPLHTDRAARGPAQRIDDVREERDLAVDLVKVIAGEASRADGIALADRGVTLGGLPDLQLGLRFGEGVPPVGAGIHSLAI